MNSGHRRAHSVDEIRSVSTKLYFVIADDIAEDVEDVEEENDAKPLCYFTPEDLSEDGEVGLWRYYSEPPTN